MVKRALIVGASGGLGAAFTALLLGDPAVDEVIGWSRTPVIVTNEKWRAARVDLLDEETIASAARTLVEVDVVIVASGLLHDGRDMRPEKTWRSLDRATMLRSFEVNTIGPALVAKHVLPLMPRGRRADFPVWTARGGSISDNRLGGWHRYRASKAALNQVIKCLAVELKTNRPEAICVGLHPGTVDTQLSKPFQATVEFGKLLTPEKSAECLIRVINTVTSEESGRVYDWSGKEVLP